MYVSTRNILYGLLALSSLALTLCADTIVASAQHPPNMSCRECHLAGAATTRADAAQLTASQEMLCGNCHPGALTVAHPTGFPANRTLPPEYPLDWKGDVTCSTCHESHAAHPGRLRGSKRNKALCVSCHEPAFFERMADAGLSLQHSGHIAAKMDTLPGIELDSYTLHCLGCHADKMRGGTVTVDRRGILRHASGSVSHPIGALYSNPNTKARFHPASNLRPEILLPDGRVSCVSCHEGYREKHGALVMSNSGSALCLECHDI